MAFDAHKNFAYSSVVTAPSPAGSGTSLVVQTGGGANFPATPFNATVWPAGSQPFTSNAEIVRVTNISGDTFTITRTQESTAARSILIGDQIAATITAKTLTDIETGSPSRLGASNLIYRYTVTGSDKASIDTGVDTADAGSNDWTNGDLLEVWIYVRTDEAAALSSATVTFNNDSSSIYDRTRTRNLNATVTGGAVAAAAGHLLDVAGASLTASNFSLARFSLPNFAGTTGFKAGEYTESIADATLANSLTIQGAFTYRSTSAITRVAVTAPSTKNLKVGSQLLIYKRLAS